MPVDLVADVRQQEQRIAAVEARIKAAVAQSNTILVQLFGVGPVLAATFLGEVGDIGRFPTKHHFAAHTGTAPLEASSGQVVLHRLSRSGDRKLNLDRIAAAANANKQLIYAYFGSKDQLFDAVLTTRFRALTEDVPFTPDDLAGYVGRLFDYLVERPEVMRLATWAGLERPTAVAAFEADSYRTKLIAITDAQRDGRLDPSFAPADLLALALGVIGAWFTASEALRTHDSPNPWSPQRLAQFRAAAVQATTRILGNTSQTADKTD